MPKQPAFPGLRNAMKKKVTRREQFLAEMDAVVPWGRLLALIAPHYPKASPKGGRPPMLLETMLRVYFLQNWYALSDPMAEETLYDSEAMRRFAGIELGDDRIPDETTILNFRHLLERHGLTEALFAAGQGLGCHAQGPERQHDASPRRTDQSHHRDGQGKGRAPVPCHQAAVRLHENALSGAGQEPRPDLHTIRARQPIPGATEADDMRTSLPDHHQTAPTAGLKGRNPAKKPGGPPTMAILPPSRRSRTR
jgi:hypothetical protein